MGLPPHIPPYGTKLQPMYHADHYKTGMGATLPIRQKHRIRPSCGPSCLQAMRKEPSLFPLRTVPMKSLSGRAAAPHALIGVKSYLERRI